MELHGADFAQVSDSTSAISRGKSLVRQSIGNLLLLFGINNFSTRGVQVYNKMPFDGMDIGRDDSHDAK